MAWLFTVFALISFAFNSILCRLALGAGSVDPSSYNTIRMAAGSITLLFILPIITRRAGRSDGLGTRLLRDHRRGIFWLVVYGIPFSHAYASLDAGVGALLLFGSVQVTMIGSALREGTRPRPVEWIGLALALGGLVYLVFPGLSAPDPVGSALMVLAGFAWGMYTLEGRRKGRPVEAITASITGAVPAALLASLIMLGDLHVTLDGAAYAALAGSVTTGLGYVMWYSAMQSLTATRASILQLTVPVIAAAGGVLLLEEQISVRLLVAGSVILGGVGLSLVRGQPRP